LIWVIALCFEIIVRMILILNVPATHPATSSAPVHLLLREAIFTASNPLTSLLRTVESQSGVSLRSSWAISFLKRSLSPLILVLTIFAWLMTSLSIVETHQFGIREQFGRLAGKILLPGLHLAYPWPFGRIRSYPVKTVRQLPIGFVEIDEPLQRNQPRMLLWTKPHAKEEFSLVLADGTELVAINALVYFKISEDPIEFQDYVYRQANPEESLLAFAYRALMEETRGKTLDDVLSLNRAAFARQLADSVRRQVRDARLGLDIIDLALLNIHPPIEAGGSYLEVINARLDARRRVTEAEGIKQVALLDAEMRGKMAITTAQVGKSRRVSEASTDVAEFKALNDSIQASPKSLQLRLWIEALEAALTNQRFYLVDQTLLDGGSDLLLDTRSIGGSRFQVLDTNPNAPRPELTP
jgi:regulator of protease activity HflC (stomatin/prohibitin superfamily)